MSHVDDGELTAYADGAYPADDPVALRIGEHLSTCGNCRTRLEQNAELRTRAAEILHFATPLSMSAPAFETIEAQARTPMRRSKRTFPLAWAASVILAIGLGWFGRGAWQQPFAEQQVATRSVPAEAAQDHVIEETATAPAPPAVVPAPVRTQREAGAGASVRREAVGSVASANVAAADAAAPQAAPAAPPPPAASVQPLAEQKLELAELAVTGMAASERTEYVSAEEAERRGLLVPSIAGLPLRRIGLRGNIMLVEQTLPDNRVVTVRVVDAVRADLAASAPTEVRKSRAAAAAAESRAVMPGRTITIEADLPPDSIRALQTKIRWK